MYFIFTWTQTAEKLYQVKESFSSSSLFDDGSSTFFLLSFFLFDWQTSNLTRNSYFFQFPPSKSILVFARNKNQQTSERIKAKTFAEETARDERKACKTRQVDFLLTTISKPYVKHFSFVNILFTFIDHKYFLLLKKKNGNKLNDDKNETN